MDEVENPALPAAGMSSPTLRPLGSDEDPGSTITEASQSELQSDNVQESARFGGLDPADPAPNPSRFGVQSRPSVQRETSVPPPQQPPPAPPVQTNSDMNEYSQDPPDSLTLADLKRIRNSFPAAVEPQRQQVVELRDVYDFDYRDAQSLPCELEEWFSYSEEEEKRLYQCKAVFDQEWRASEHGKQDWLNVTEDARRAFTKRWIQVLNDPSQEQDVANALMILTYLGLGVWEETAGRNEGCALEDLFNDSGFGGSRLEEYGRSSLQIQWIVAMVDTLHACDGLSNIYDTLRRICEDDFANSAVEPSLRDEGQAQRGDTTIELWCALTLMYLFVEVARTTTNARALKQDVVALDPNILSYLTQIVARMRWDENAPIPLTKMLLLAWKAILVCFGGIADIEQLKKSLQKQEVDKDVRGAPIITASPLDYHLFRQEISSKYPAYQPPLPLFPLEPEHNSILPPLSHRRPSVSRSDAAITGAPNIGSDSIMHQPMHIATPAPSPPPSPGGPGKAGKKQNYQTNQLFPFLYPPLDASSNDLGGKGSTELQDTLVGRRWEGSDVPSSILEGAELFAQRMRATRGMQQMWDARDDFMKEDRGWETNGDPSAFIDVDAREELRKGGPAYAGQKVPPEAREVIAKVNAYYKDCLPHLQSLVVVMLKVILQNVTELVTKSGHNGFPSSIQLNDMNGHRTMENSVNFSADSIENAVDEANKQRSQEILAKALGAIILLLLKWFRLSHVLQYEYMTQLLLDANFVPLIVRVWQSQDIGRACHIKQDREDRGFFYYCQKNSRQGAPESTLAPAMASLNEESEDEAAPPPIKRKRDDSSNELSLRPDDFSHLPEVDELGYQTTPMPLKPIKSYSYRNIFSTINYLRILQKITHRKTHRALTLVGSHKTQFLRKTLKIPVQLVRYYTLKLYKSQVPFCGRKWRQSNMKVITAVWLSVPADLRDDWLTGGGGGMGGAYVGDVDGTVEDALPLEQSLRTITHWWNLRNFPDAMGATNNVQDEGMDFFTRELEKMDLLREDEMADGQSLAEGLWEGPVDGY
jgi:hypothetical protein